MAELPYSSSSPFGIDRGADNYAALTQAALLRANWDESQAELQPLLGRLRALYSNPQGAEEASQAAGGIAGGAFDRSMRTTERDMARLGVQLSPDQQTAFKQVSEHSRGLAETGAKNMAARGHEDLRQQIAVGIG